MSKQIINVALIDDEIDLCENFCELFKKEGLKIQSYSNPIVALEKMQKSPPDIAFIDYRMPIMNGDELAKAMPEKVKKYLLTGELEVRPSFEFEGILGKPLEIDRIRKILDQLLVSG